MSEESLPDAEGTPKEDAEAKAREDEARSQQQVSDMLMSFIGLCDMISARVERAADGNGKLGSWTPMVLLHSAAVMAKKEFLAATDRLAD